MGRERAELDGEYVFRQLAQITGGKFVFSPTRTAATRPAARARRPTTTWRTTRSTRWNRLIVRLVRRSWRT
ncbi:MAG: hypothetical protein R2851_13680 [Caldilineaceae bacterium]